MTCTRCGERSRLASVFHHRRRLLRADECLCPPCAVARRGWAEHIGSALARYAWIGALIAMSFEMYAHRMLFLALGLTVIPLAMTVAHECTHALAGWWMGARVFELRIGAGPPRWSRIVGGVRVTLCAHYMGGGLCCAVFPDLQTRTQAAVFTGAPLLLHAVIAAMLWPQVSAATLFTLSGALLCAIFAYNLLLVLLNLWPHDVVIGAGVYPSDGKRLLSIVRSPAYIEAYRGYAPVFLCSYAALNGEKAEAARYAEALRQAYPSPTVTPDVIAGAGYMTEQYEETAAFLRDLPVDESPLGEAELQQQALGSFQVARLPALVRSLVLCKAGRADEAIALLETSIASLPDGLYRVALQNNLAYFLARYRPTDRNLERAAALIRDSLEALPWVGYIRGTAGTVCILLGRYKVGLAHFQKASAAGEDPHNQSVRSAYSALAYAKLGQPHAAAEALQRARIMSGDDDLIADIEQRIAAG